MICDLNYDNPYFTLEKVSRKKRFRYGFVGLLDKEIKKIMNKLNNKDNIIPSEKKILEEKFGNTSKSWYDLKSNTVFKYIEDRIYLTDTLNIIRNKVTYYLKNNDIILPVNQQFWFTTKNKKYRVIGTIYEQINNIPIITQYSKKNLMSNKDTFIVKKMEI